MFAVSAFKPDLAFNSDAFHLLVIFMDFQSVMVQYIIIKKVAFRLLNAVSLA